MPHRLTTLRRYKVSNDVLVVILGYLDPQSLWRACKALRRVYNLVMEYLPLRYTFELAIAGMKDGPASHSRRPPNLRLQLLQSYRKDWPKLNWSHECTILIPRHARFGLSGSFLHQIRHEGGQFVLDLTELPAFRTGTPPSRTRHIRFSTPQVENVVLDYAQGLIITSHVFSAQDGQIHVRLYIRDLWTFGKHPRSVSAVYDFSTRSPTRLGSLVMVTCGDKMAISLEFSGGNYKHLILNWQTLHARWLDEQSILFLNENYVLVAKKSRGLPVLDIYNIHRLDAVTVEREYELPQVWSESRIELVPNTAPMNDWSPASQTLFYPDPLNRIALVTAKHGQTGAPQSWLFINESHFRPTSRPERLRVPWSNWGQYCLIRDVVPRFGYMTAPQLVGSRVLYLEVEPVHAHSRNGGYHGGHRDVGRFAHLNLIDFVPFPDSPMQLDRAWSKSGARSLLVPSEMSREVPAMMTESMGVEDVRLTEDNVILFLESRDGGKPVSILSFGSLAAPRSRHEMHSPQL